MTAPLITLEAWRDKTYGAESRPSMRTVRLWNAGGYLVPAAKKQGRTYYIAADARYIDPREPAPQRTILERIRATEATKRA